MAQTDSQVLAIDVGTGTQDILLYDPRRSVENSVQLVLPSPVAIAAAKAREATRTGLAICLTGGMMGGWPLNTALKQHIAHGYRVFATPGAARTIHDDPHVVKAMGIGLTETPPVDAVEIECRDVDLDRLGKALALYGLEVPGRVAVAVQDHGESIGVSNRDTRSDVWRRFIAAGGRLRELAYVGEVPAVFTRMTALREAVPGAIVMDTGPAAIFGALLDEYAALHRDEGLVVLNVGNGHTIGALVQGDRMWGLFEEHTHVLTTEKLGQYVEDFRHGRLTHEQVYAGGGHGCYYHPEYQTRAPFRSVVLTGPRRGLAGGLGYHSAVPFGDMMLAGCFGLLAAGGLLGTPPVR